jgi:hypothetical protein
MGERLSARKLSVAVVIALVCGAVAFAGIAFAGAVRTKVTIQAQQGGFFGYVHSRKQSCEAGRKVALYRQKGSSPDRSVDDKIGTDIAQPNGPDSQWSVNTNKHGMFYAFAHRIQGCKKGMSETVRSQ